MRISIILVVCLSVAFLASAGTGLAQEPGSTVASDSRVTGLTYKFEETGVDVPYAMFVPSTYDASKAWPLIVGLHGLGRPFDWIMSYDGYVDMAETYGYILVTPKGYHPRAWYGSRGPGIPPMSNEEDVSLLPPNLGELAEQDVMNVLEIVRREYSIDPNRIYLWGHSMGGAGTYHLAAKYPNLWAAVGVAAPAPSVSPYQLQAFRHIPIIALQGDEDRLVLPMRRWVAMMEELGMEHVYVEVKGGDHSRFINSDSKTLSKLFYFFNVVTKDRRPETN